MWIQQVVSVCSKLRVKIFKGSPIPPISNALEPPPPQNDDPLPDAKGEVKTERAFALAVRESADRVRQFAWIVRFNSPPLPWSYRWQPVIYRSAFVDINIGKGRLQCESRC